MDVTDDGEFIAAVGGHGREAGTFNAPRGVAVSPGGRVFVALENGTLNCLGSK